MALHAGEPYCDRDVCIGPPNPEAVRSAPKTPDVADSVERWLSRALEREDVYYFSINYEGQLVGQILLHDIAWQDGEALVGYHQFEPRYRAIGIGRTALALLQRFVVESTRLTALVIITSRDNAASQRVAQACGFIPIGASREDPFNGLVFRWETRAGRATSESG